MDFETGKRILILLANGNSEVKNQINSILEGRDISSLSKGELEDLYNLTTIVDSLQQSSADIISYLAKPCEESMVKLQWL